VEVQLKYSFKISPKLRCNVTIPVEHTITGIGKNKKSRIFQQDVYVSVGITKLLSNEK